MVTTFDHPNIKQLVEYGIEENTLHLIYTTSSTSLQSYIDSSREIPIDKILSIIHSLATGLNYLHKSGFIHRAFKPKYILFEYKQPVKIAGLKDCIRVSYDSFETKDYSVYSPCYVSPEFLSSKPYNHKSDIWALGIIFYQLLTKTHPFGDITKMEMLIENIKNGSIAWPVHFNEQVLTLLQGMLNRDVSKRFSAQDILNLFD
eukprot:gene3325-4168_t